MSKKYTPLFVPKAIDETAAASEGDQMGDRSPERVYVFNEATILAVNVSLATGRPLLVRGMSGTGKTSLAKSIAYHLEWRYREAIITARSQARDLLWTVDLVLRLQDAQMGRLSDDWKDYVYPGPIWSAFDEDSAQKQLALKGKHQTKNEAQEQTKKRTVLLIDEIDKADPDVPNNLLRPLGDLAFEVEETGQKIVAQLAPLVIITTNEERDLPPAFLRRCVELNMPQFKKSDLVAIGRSHFDKIDHKLLSETADVVMEFGQRRDRRGVNAAEYLDILHACTELKLNASSSSYKQLVEITLGISDQKIYDR